MSELEKKIITHLEGENYRPSRPRNLAKDLNLDREESYHAFRDALRELMDQGRVVVGQRGVIVLPTARERSDEIIGVYQHNARRGFGFVIPRDPGSREDLFIPPGQNGGALTGDVVRAKIANRGHRDGRAISDGRVFEIVERTQKRFVGTLVKQGAQWMVMPDGNTLTNAILAPDAASRHVPPGTKVVVELTSYGDDQERPQGVITEILGQAGEKDVDLKSVIVQFNLPGDFPDAVKEQARHAVDSFDPEFEKRHRFDLSDEVICTIDPDDAKDYDDAISLRRLDDGDWELGVHIADVSHFVPAGSALDMEAMARGNSAYFPGHVIPMLPEVLSNGVCSLQEGVPRLCKSVFIVYDEDARPVRTRFANTVIRSALRLRYREAQAILDNAPQVPHPEGPRRISDYPEPIVELLRDMDALAKRLQQRRLAQGQIVLELPEIDLVLDENGKVVDAVPEDQGFTHTLIEMFMVEANEAIARLLDSQGVPFIRRIHPGPDAQDGQRLRHFAGVVGHHVDKNTDHKAIQRLLAAVRGKPESFAINLAVLKSLSRAEYSPEAIWHYALASEHYTHYTSPIRRYADLMIHRLLDEYLAARDAAGADRKQRKLELKNVIPYDELVKIGRQISFTERRADDAERELRKVKILELMAKHIGDEFTGVVTGITNFGIFVQIQTYLVDGLIRYPDLLDDWWDVDERSGVIRGQRTGKKIGIGDVVKVIIVNVDVPRRELGLSVREVVGHAGPHAAGPHAAGPHAAGPGAAAPRTGAPPRGGSTRGGSSRGGSSRGGKTKAAPRSAKKPKVKATGRGGQTRRNRAAKQNSRKKGK